MVVIITKDNIKYTHSQLSDTECQLFLQRFFQPIFLSNKFALLKEMASEFYWV